MPNATPHSRTALIGEGRSPVDLRVASRPRSALQTVRASAVWTGDVQAVADDLRRALAGEVCFDTAHRALYATDASNYRQVPIGVVFPRHADDVIATVEICRRHAAPILARGGGTSLSGQCCNVAVLLDFSRHMHQVRELRPDERSARVDPGTVLDHLRDAAEAHGLTFGPDPSTHNHCTLGGMIGNNSCGVHSVMAGRTSDNVIALDVLTYDGLRLEVGTTSDTALDAIIRAGGRRGEIYRRLRQLRDRYGDEIRRRFPDIPRRISGYNLPALLPENGFQVAQALVGSESTCVLVLGATVRLVPSPPQRVILVVGFRDVYSAADHVPALRDAGPIGLEGMDRELVELTKRKGQYRAAIDLLPEGDGWLITEFGAEDKRDAHTRAARLCEQLRRSADVIEAKVLDADRDQELIWGVRKAGLGVTAWVPGEPDGAPGWEDSAVPPDTLGRYMRDVRSLMKRYGYRGSFYGHFGDGCLHTRISFDMRSAPGIASYRRFVDDAADLVVRYRGSFSGEHGDGQSRAELLPKMYGERICEAFREFKAIWDPEWRMNPGKVVRPYPITSNLRLGSSYRPPDPPTEFRYPEDEHRFARAALRCIGIGECRKTHGGTMCPSYMVTADEMHATRGRAHLLWEMLHGDPIGRQWRSPAVRDALDLCLACKGCKGECPVRVDMASYKAEFLFHYYRHRLRPMAAYSMGLIYWWARLASRAPRLVNALARSPLRRVLQSLGGIDRRRTVPAFATETFRHWFARQPAPRAHAENTVVLWADTFTNFLEPGIARAAVAALRHAGYEVTIPRAMLCCGRPLYDFGMLRLAKRQLRQILTALGPEIDAGVPVVGLEPSCVATFRDELGELFPEDERAGRLAKQTMLLSELLDRQTPHAALPSLHRKALVHGHCHHKSILGFEAEARVLDRLGLDYQVLDSGCCGMAGSFGFERSKYDVSIACGERVLLPAVRSAAAETLIVADGFSCREQIRQTTGRTALHVAEVIAMGLGENDGSNERRP